MEEEKDEVEEIGEGETDSMIYTKNCHVINNY